MRHKIAPTRQRCHGAVFFEGNIATVAVGGAERLANWQVGPWHVHFVDCSRRNNPIVQRGNPAIFPLIYGCWSHDVVVVHLTLLRPDVPMAATEIIDRSNEISFNSSLIREMRMIKINTRLIDEGKMADGSVKRMFTRARCARRHGELRHASKPSADWA